MSQPLRPKSRVVRLITHTESSEHLTRLLASESTGEYSQMTHTLMVTAASFDIIGGIWGGGGGIIESGTEDHNGGFTKRKILQILLLICLNLLVTIDKLDYA